MDHHRSIIMVMHLAWAIGGRSWTPTLNKFRSIIMREMVSRGHLNRKILTYHYGESHCKDMTVPWPIFLYNGNLHTWKDRIYIVTGPWYRACHLCNILNPSLFSKENIGVKCICINAPLNAVAIYFTRSYLFYQNLRHAYLMISYLQTQSWYYQWPLLLTWINFNPSK